jgi:hypothetical protein
MSAQSAAWTLVSAGAAVNPLHAALKNFNS